ncbi:MAG: hypothetical protein HY711_11475, partial [Candidatus Melainabacteria bacterium]|nr:hypothetical protein [Candidatus Melainabacteria bacterium]
VTVIGVDSLDDIRTSLLMALSQDNPEMPTPDVVTEPGSVVLEAVGIRRWEAFERGAVLYTLHRKASGITMYVTGRGADGMWTERKDKEKLFDARVPLEQVVELILEDVLQQPEVQTKEPSLPMLLPPPEL